MNEEVLNNCRYNKNDQKILKIPVAELNTS